MTVVRNTPGAGELPPPPNQLMKYERHNKILSSPSLPLASAAAASTAAFKPKGSRGQMASSAAEGPLGHAAVRPMIHRNGAADYGDPI